MAVLDGLHRTKAVTVLTRERMTQAINGSAPDGYKLKSAHNVLPCSN